MNEYVNENADIFDDEPKKQNIVVRIIKWFFLGIVILICSTVLVQCYKSLDHDIVDQVLMDESFFEKYEEVGSELVVEKYGMQSAWVEVRKGRLVEFNELYYIPALKQMQFSVKYNEDLPQCEYEGSPFRMTLVDDVGNEFTDCFFKHEQRYKFKYIRVCFNDIDIYTDIVDENGMEIRRQFTLVMEVTDGEGGYKPLCTYKIYDGSRISKNVKYKVKK